MSSRQDISSDDIDELVVDLLRIELNQVKSANAQLTSSIRQFIEDSKNITIDDSVNGEEFSNVLQSIESYKAFKSSTNKALTRTEIQVFVEVERIVNDYNASIKLIGVISNITKQLQIIN